MNSRRNLIMAAALAFTAIGYTASAQDETDALRYSFLSPQGTARSIGIGSALGSVGGDFTSLSVNPAGIGIYRKSELMFTPSFRFNNVDASYLNERSNEGSTRFNFGNAGIVFTWAEKGKRYERSHWKTVSFAFGINRLADFNRSYSYGGLIRDNVNNYSSFSGIFVEDALANPDHLDPDFGQGTLGYMAYNTYLINPDSFGNIFSAANRMTGLKQLHTVTEHGGINEMVISLGGNYEEKLMIGGTIGLPMVRYTRDALFQESDATNNTQNFFNYFRYNESLTTKGLGVNLKLGMIFKPTDLLRFGVAFHSPTWYSLNDEYSNDLFVDADEFNSSINGATSTFEYYLTTPWRGILSATALMGEYGFITADYEYVDYGSVRYRFPDEFSYDEKLRNDAIKKSFQAASNFRIGIEGRMDNFMLRAGFGYYGNPYKVSSEGSSRMDFSAGIGFRTSSFFTDLGFVHTSYDVTDHPYTLSAPSVSPTAKLENGLNNLALTIGWKL
jgi:hypothetical protein